MVDPLTPKKAGFAPDPSRRVQFFGFVADPADPCLVVHRIKSTPIKSKNLDAGTAKQVTVRNGLGAYNNPDMLVCDVKDFLESYHPCKNGAKPDRDVDMCFKAMLSADFARSPGGAPGVWTAYATHTPSKLKVAEPLAFESLKPIVDGVFNFVKRKVGQKPEQGMQFMLVPNSTLTSDIPGSGHKIDGCLVARPLVQLTDKKVPHREIIVPMEFKKKRDETQRAQVHKQILGACHHIMNEDIRRMWIYGLTLEDNLCSVWYFSRSHSVKAKAFEWVKDPRTFIRVLLAFAKATPAELGIDPTVHLGPKNEDGTTSFVYQVPAGRKFQYFQTIQSVCDPRPMCIAGRTTRVWTVVQVPSAKGNVTIGANEKRVILKDVWLNADSKTEAENMDAIFKAVDDFVEKGLEAEKKKDRNATPEELLKRLIDSDPRFEAFDQASKDRLRSNLTNQAYKSLFLTKLFAWKGEVCKPLGQNVWRSPALFEPTDSSENPTSNVKSAVSTRQGNREDATQPKLDEEQERLQQQRDAEYAARRFAPKRQTRFIYQEVCTTLQNLNNVGEVVDVLCQTVEAMHILFLAGWVHRDISSNNIMAYRSDANQPWAVKLADLEFSRVMVDEARKPSADPRTGTPFFMPVEILRRSYFLDDFYRRDKIVGRMNLATQLNAADRGEEYVQNLKRFRAIKVTEKETLLAEVPSDPQWNQVPEQYGPVNHNYQHDLESIWWIVLWVVTCRIGYATSATTFNRYFSHDIEDVADRQILLTNGLEGPSSFFQKDIDEAFSTPLDSLSDSMYRKYLMRVVFGRRHVDESYSSIQAEFATSLRSIQATAGPWRVIPLQKKSKFQGPPATKVPGTAGTNVGKRERGSEEEDAAKPVKRTRGPGN